MAGDRKCCLGQASSAGDNAEPMQQELALLEEYPSASTDQGVAGKGSDEEPHMELQLDGFDMRPSPETPTRKARPPAALKIILHWYALLARRVLSQLHCSSPCSFVLGALIIQLTYVIHNVVVGVSLLFTRTSHLRALLTYCNGSAQALTAILADISLRQLCRSRVTATGTTAPKRTQTAALSGAPAPTMCPQAHERQALLHHIVIASCKQAHHV
jgi:hypothetical protein